MEHSLPPLDAVARPWRRATLIAGSLAAIEGVVLVVAAVALLGKPVAHHLQKAAVKRAFPPVVEARRQPVGKPTLTRRQTSVLVLNGNGHTGAAAGAAERVHRFGYIIGAVGNARRTDYARNVVMYRPKYRAEGVRLAHDLRVRIVGPLDGIRSSELMGAHVAFVVGA